MICRPLRFGLASILTCQILEPKNTEASTLFTWTKMRGKKKKLLSLQKSKKRTTVKFKQTTVKYQRVAFPPAYGGKVSLKVTYQGARSTPSIDKHWRARLAASPSPHNIHWQMKNKKQLKGTNMSEGDSTKQTFIMTGRKKRNEWPRVHAWSSL